MRPDHQGSEDTTKAVDEDKERIEGATRRSRASGRTRNKAAGRGTDGWVVKEKTRTRRPAATSNRGAPEAASLTGPVRAEKDQAALASGRSRALALCGAPCSEHLSAWRPASSSAVDGAE